MRYHVKNVICPGGVVQWAYEEVQVRSSATRAVLTRMLGGKVLKPDVVSTTMKKVPAPQNDPNFTCRIWVRRGVQQLVNDKIIYLAVLDWATMGAEALVVNMKDIGQSRMMDSTTTLYTITTLNTLVIVDPRTTVW
ncbi:hypothetical protein RUND412_007244 [Rhizina undulata]